jgi:hypothetical protein
MNGRLSQSVNVGESIIFPDVVNSRTPEVLAPGFSPSM